MASKVTVLALGPTPPPYHGVATFMRDLLEHSPGADFVWRHLDTSDRRDATNLGRWDPENLKLGFSHLTELAQTCLRGKIDFVYVPLSQNIPAFLRDALFILQARALGARVVVHLHGGYFRTLYEKDAGMLFRLFARFVLRRAAAVIVLGEEFRPIFSGLAPEKRIHVVENGVPDPGAWRLRAERPAGETILYMSTLTRTKGILELLSAVARLRQNRPAVRLKVAGAWADADLREEALALVARENLSAHVGFAGNVSGAEKAAFLASGDIFCLPTHYPYEGQPLVLLEALAAGLPIVSTAHGVIASTTPDGVVGHILPKDASPELLAQTFDAMLADTALLKNFSENARQRYLERYTLEACHQRLVKIFECLTK